MDFKKIELPDALKYNCEGKFFLDETSFLFWVDDRGFIMSLPECSFTEIPATGHPNYRPPSSVVKADGYVYLLGEKEYSRDAWFLRLNLDSMSYEELPVSNGFRYIARAKNNVIARLGRIILLFDTAKLGWIDITEGSPDKLSYYDGVLFSGDELLYVPTGRKTGQDEYDVLQSIITYKFNPNTRNWSQLENPAPIKGRNNYNSTTKNKPLIWLGYRSTWEGANENKDMYDGIIYKKESGWEKFIVSGEARSVLPKNRFDLQGSQVLDDDSIVFCIRQYDNPGVLLPYLYSTQTNTMTSLASDDLSWYYTNSFYYAYNNSVLLYQYDYEQDQNVCYSINLPKK